MKRSHHKTPITEVHPRKEWTALKGKNQRLVMGYLVALTAKNKKNNFYHKGRGHIDKVKEMWWGVRVSVHEIAQFLHNQTKKNQETCRKNARRALSYLHSVGYIMIYDESKLPEVTQKSLRVDQYKINKAIEVLWDDDKGKKHFFAPRFPNLSISGGTSGGTFDTPQVGHFDASGGTQVGHLPPSGGTFHTPNVPPDIEEYGSTEPQNPDFQGASYINELTNNGNSPTTVNVVGPFSDFPLEEATHGKDKNGPPPAPREPVTIALVNTPHPIHMDDLPEPARYTYPANFKQPEKVAPLFSYWETPGIGDDPILVTAAKKLIAYFKEKYNYDMAPLFEAENYRRIVAPDLRNDIPLTFEPVNWETSIYARRPLGWSEPINYLNWDDVRLCPDQTPYGKAVFTLQFAPRGLEFRHDIGAYWQPPLVSVVHDYSSYTASAQFTESPFHRDHTLEQVTGIVTVPWRSDIIRKRQIFWLMGTSATHIDGLRYLLPKFTADLLKNPQSPLYRRYQKMVLSGKFGNTNIINWFKDRALLYHYNGWYLERATFTDGSFMCTKHGHMAEDVMGFTVGADTAWGQFREVFMTPHQYKVFTGFEVIKETKEALTNILNDIGQKSL
jgi:hypothetical protein